VSTFVVFWLALLGSAASLAFGIGLNPPVGIAGLAIALVAVYLAALGTGQKFDRGGRSSHPTTSTSDVPVDPTE
jgi:hypothetical protein